MRVSDYAVLDRPRLVSNWAGAIKIFVRGKARIPILTGDTCGWLDAYIGCKCEKYLNWIDRRHTNTSKMKPRIYFFLFQALYVANAALEAVRNEYSERKYFDLLCNRSSLCVFYGYNYCNKWTF